MDRIAVARIAEEAGLGASDAAGLVALGPEDPAEARELARLFGSRDSSTMRRLRQRSAAYGSPGRRFVRSAAYSRLRETIRGSATVILPRFEHMAPVGGVNAMVGGVSAQTVSSFPATADRRVFARLEPTRALVPGLVTTIDDVERDLVRSVSEDSRTDGAGGVPDGAATGESHVVLGSEELEMHRWGTQATVGVRALEDPGNARAVIDRFVRDLAARSLEADILEGDGTETATTVRLTGIINDPDVTTVTRQSGESRLDALVRAGISVLNGEHVPPLVAVIHPDDLEALVLEKDADGKTEAVRRKLDEIGIEDLAPSSQITAGTAIVGAWAPSAWLLLKGGFELEVFNQHEDYASRGLALLSLETRAQLDLLPSGFAIVEGL